MTKKTFGVVLAAVLAGMSAFAEAKDPVAPFDDYGPAMEPTAGDPMAVEWQNANDAALQAATEESVLAAVVADAESARALLAKVKDAYKTCPLVACQVAAVTQWVMGEDPFVLWFWADKPSAGRKVWVKALLETAETTDELYVKMFCLEQLRWCGCACPCVKARLAKIAAASGTPVVRDFVDQVVRGLK